MADFPRGDQALALACANAIYPDGLQGSSITGRHTVIKCGWLSSDQRFALQSPFKENDFISVTTCSSTKQSISEPLSRQWNVLEKISANVSLRVKETSLEVVFPSFERPVGIVGIWSNNALSERAVYAVGKNDTPSTVVEALSEQMPGLMANENLLLFNNKKLDGRVVGYGKSECVERRQNLRYRISIWTNSIEAREALGESIDIALSEKNWVTLLNGQEAQLQFSSVEDIDTMQDQNIFRRDYFYDLIFNIVNINWSPELLCGVTHIKGEEKISIEHNIELLNLSKRSLENMNNIISTEDAFRLYNGMEFNKLGIVIENNK